MEVRNMQASLSDAAMRWPDLVAAILRGEPVELSGEDGTTVRLVPEVKRPPKFGSAQGLVEMSDDFDAPIAIDANGFGDAGKPRSPQSTLSGNPSAILLSKSSTAYAEAFCTSSRSP